MDLQRLHVGDAWAFERLGAGHCYSDAQLRCAAVELFDAYHCNFASPGGVH